MKKSSLKLMIALWPPAALQAQNQAYLVPDKQLRQLVPQLTDSGFRSLLFHLAKQGVLFLEKAEAGNLVRLTYQGTELLKAKFPALQTESQATGQEWSVLVFTEAPKSDHQFRFLRQRLLGLHAVSLNRGVYLYPGKFPESFIQECHVSYAQSLLLFSTADWLFGDLRAVILQKFQLTDLVSIYSGVSSELSQLISSFSQSKKTNHQSKKALCLLFDRWWDGIQQDSGLLAAFYPGHEPPTTWLERWQKVFFPD